MTLRDWSREKVGMLQPLYVVGSDNGAIWRCRCDCGNEVDRKSSSLTNAKRNGYKNTSCGCMKSNQNTALNKAKREGRERYFTGIPCKNGHIAERRVNGRACVECEKEKDIKHRHERLEYFKRYQRENKEKARAASERYKERNRDKVLAANARYRSLQENKKKRTEWQRSRNHAKRSGGGIVSAQQITEIHNKQRGMCANCNIKLKKYHVDHIHPISLGGSNHPDNLQLLCVKCNLRKGAADPFDWANKNGRLL